MPAGKGFLAWLPPREVLVEMYESMPKMMPRRTVAVCLTLLACTANCLASAVVLAVRSRKFSMSANVRSSFSRMSSAYSMHCMLGVDQE